jgi:cell division protein FtsB
MSEDYTYPTTPTLADLRTRVAELERENAELRERQSAQFERSTARLVDVALDAERQAQRVAELERQLAQDDSNMVTLAARNAELERENAAAVKLLDTCLKFFDTLDDDYPPALDYAIRHFKRQAAGEVSWDESSDQTLRRELDAAFLKSVLL